MKPQADWRDYQPFVGGFLLVAGLLTAHHLQILQGSLFERALQNALHIPAFAVLGYFVGRWRPAASLAGGLILCVSVALILEATQIFVARDASFQDLFADSAGASLGLVIARGRPLVRMLGGILLILVTAWSPALIWLSYQERDRMFPLLIGDTTYRSPLFSSNGEISGTMPSQPGWRVCWRDVEYPGIQLDEVVRPWDGYETLRIDFVVEGSLPMALTVAVGHVGVPGTSAFVAEEFSAGPHLWDVAVSALDHGGALISHLIIHSRPAHAGRCIRVQGVELR